MLVGETANLQKNRLVPAFIVSAITGAFMFVSKPVERIG
jgi:hypothetical protein